MTIKYKVRDKLTGKFWNGETRRSLFNDQGKVWNKIESVENTISYFVKWRDAWSNRGLAGITHNLPDQWEIVEVEIIYKEKSKQDLTEFMNYQALRSKVTAMDASLGYFVDRMRKLKMLDKIEFIFKLKPAEGEWYVSFERIKEARAHLRQLGVKTRTFKEHNGYFGMVDRDQALKARLTLDTALVVDLAKIRKELGQ